MKTGPHPTRKSEKFSNLENLCIESTTLKSQLWRIGVFLLEDMSNWKGTLREAHEVWYFSHHNWEGELEGSYLPVCQMASDDVQEEQDAIVEVKDVKDVDGFSFVL